jgi:hypothetical protein
LSATLKQIPVEAGITDKDVGHDYRVQIRLKMATIQLFEVEPHP